MSTVSCTSFTGRSTQSEPRDREVMATETILHWRNLPLSLTFRTWLKFTRQRKLQKELLNYITNNKTTELMSKTLGKWRRELYTKVTARQHWVGCFCCCLYVFITREKIAFYTRLYNFVANTSFCMSEIL